MQQRTTPQYHQTKHFQCRRANHSIWEGRHFQGHGPKARANNKFRRDQRLPEEDRFDVLDQADDVIKELSAPVTDKGKVYRGLKRLGRFISSVASKPLAHFVAQLAVAYAKAHGV